MSDFPLAAYGRKATLLGLLNRSATLNGVDHVTLFQRLLGLTEEFINWICSFLSGRPQQVVYNGIKSLTLYRWFLEYALSRQHVGLEAITSRPSYWPPGRQRIKFKLVCSAFHRYSTTLLIILSITVISLLVWLNKQHVTSVGGFLFDNYCSTIARAAGIF